MKWISLALLASSFVPALARAQPTSQPAISKAERIFIKHGLQIHGLAFVDDPFHLNVLKAASFNGVNWNWKTKPAAMGKPPGELFWNYWVNSEKDTSLKPDEQPYAAKLVALQLRDEQDMNNPEVRAAAAKWFEA